ncbi:uncharacterized protein CYBJADRAFT_165459 [Cyberlindnera jadinii NRRL Y-1542]|uniref:Uncharacterized protein n=1 Tax=Cyberlindnera jadinii (strain ATCC 18201 / CBS 1600 / BCRC 20928 / JCM 3617 / NBRC 0987 / NRRL Y-1542) TaxID=983966 RepID=A0A1E4S9E0_CYBJN|nr:hypothetical protein CYBJADRAFT_165459 [Cyberlindnera jadinii NRRL Y-1542]ODV76129.1 hypothetical protein CYBJADRAFT_165459 [Cyberlindnera jadinii NRRL Y-1542]
MSVLFCSLYLVILLYKSISNRCYRESVCVLVELAFKVHCSSALSTFGKAERNIFYFIINIIA